MSNHEGTGESADKNGGQNEEDGGCDYRAVLIYFFTYFDTFWPILV